MRWGRCVGSARSPRRARDPKRPPIAFTCGSAAAGNCTDSRRWRLPVHREWAAVVAEPRKPVQRNDRSGFTWGGRDRVARTGASRQRHRANVSAAKESAVVRMAATPATSGRCDRVSARGRTDVKERSCSCSDRESEHASIADIRLWPASAAFAARRAAAPVPPHDNASLPRRRAYDPQADADARSSRRMLPDGSGRPLR